jgi:xanthine dehydrogenase YagT iron-sulfur-binding subunit
MAEITLSINGQTHSVDVDPGARLLDVLRDSLEMRGVYSGCDVGYCGACSVLVDGRIQSSCLMLVGQAQGKDITTIEGLADGEDLHPVQQAFMEHVGFQCGYCTPGMILCASALLEENPAPDEAQIKAYLSANLCRCGSYVNILEAVASLADKG